MRMIVRGTFLVLSRLSRVAHVVAVVAGICILVLVSLSVVMRYLVRSPFAFTEELVGLLLAVMFFATLPMAMAEDRHIGVRFLWQGVPRWILPLFQLLAMAITVAFLVWFAYEANSQLAFTLRFDIRTEVARLPIYPWLAALPVMCLLAALVCVVRLLLIWVDATDHREPEG